LEKWSIQQEVKNMPLYIDFHAKMPTMPPEALNEIRKEIGKVGPQGVTSVAAYFTKDGQAYCLSEAPDPDAVCRAHATKGLPLAKGDVHEISAS
jgi:Protein of unknown function (DUF4242)